MAKAAKQLHQSKNARRLEGSAYNYSAFWELDEALLRRQTTRASQHSNVLPHEVGRRGRDTRCLPISRRDSPRTRGHAVLALKTMQSIEDDKYNARASDAAAFYWMRRDHVPCDIFESITDESDVDSPYCRHCFWLEKEHGGFQ